jgi:hypothetical protein
MIRETLLVQLDNIIERLSQHLPQAEVRCGWTEESREAMRSFFEQMRIDASAGKELKFLPEYVSLLRGLDHWGIASGPLFEAAAEIGMLARQT